VLFITVLKILPVSHIIPLFLDHPHTFHTFYFFVNTEVELLKIFINWML